MKKGFTLIELLIVVAIIAILAAIAVPNFLEAQVRSKISHELSNMRTDRVALESYRVDNPSYPLDASLEDYSMSKCTTPIAYLSSIPRPVFPEYRAAPAPPAPVPGSGARYPGDAGAWPNFQYSYWGGGNGLANPPSPGGAGDQFVSKVAFALVSAGPTQTRLVTPPGVTPAISVSHPDFWDKSVPRLKDPTEPGNGGTPLLTKLYDPTNGTVSYGLFVVTQNGILNSK